MRRLAGLTVLFAALILARAGWAQHPLTGSFEVTLASGDVKAVPAAMAPKMVGKWVVRFAAGGRYEVLQNGSPHVKGTFAQAGDQITLMDDDGDFACKGGDAPEGIYKVTLAQSMLTLTKVKDEECPGRVATLTARPFHIVK